VRTPDDTAIVASSGQRRHLDQLAPGAEDDNEEDGNALTHDVLLRSWAKRLDGNRAAPRIARP